MWSGAFVRSLGPTSFYPLAAGVPTPEQTEHLLAHLADPEHLRRRIRACPARPRDDPAALDNSYWRGRIWPPLNYWVWQGLRRMGRRAEASRLAESSFALFGRAWADRLCPENYNAVTGEPLDQPDTDGFYGWGALMPLMAVGEVADVSPWAGFSVTNTGEDASLGPVESPLGRVTIVVEGGVLTIRRGDAVALETDLRGTVSDLRFEPGRLSFAFDGADPAAAFVRLPGVAEPVLLARAGGRDLAVTAGPDGLAMTGFATGKGRLTVDVRWFDA